MKRHVTRRQLLATAAATGLGGCVTGGGETGANTEAGTNTGTASAPSYDVSVDHDLYGWDGYVPDWEAPTTVPTDLEVETLVTNLEIPWDLSFTPDGDLFITERTGRLLRYEDSEVVGVASPADAIDAGSVDPGTDESSWWVEGGEGGTMGVASHPNYPDVPVVYLYYTAERDDGEKVNRLAYVDVEADDPAATTETILEAPADTVHNGGRIAFGPANYLWVCVGDSGEADLASDPTSLAGSVLRVTPTGDPAPNNPERGGDADPRIYSMGHRNPQGVNWLPDASPLAVEHGPGPDEVNLLGAGGDHGWPDVRQPEEYAASDVRPPVASTALESTWAPSGCVFYTGDAVPSLRNRLLVGCLASQELKVVTLTPSEAEAPPLGETGVRHAGEWLDDRFVATTHARLTDELGRIRHVEQGPAGRLYAIVSNRDGRAGDGFPTERDDRLVRLTPAE
ncbi:PQQ-dependent sugar dehydrogenase [Haloarcula sp. JP-L23]|uniref:PQQ-dependent sugar dehydrogenase n=1 Tax=Haloarcula sp. JP-L23 TaxID=2716717 RepID=UPI00140F2419|nr:PQQ-dependent sugar dehydrogenase [Haloarcula sp. JP-L23]